MTVLFWAVISILSVAVVGVFASLMWWVEGLQETKRDLTFEVNRLKGQLGVLKAGFECHTKDNKKDMKPMRKRVDRLEGRVLTLEAIYQRIHTAVAEAVTRDGQPSQKEYQVTWIVDISADTPEEAAQQARTMQQDPTALCGAFHVQEVNHEGSLLDSWEVDLDEASVAGPYQLQA